MKKNKSLRLLLGCSPNVKITFTGDSTQKCHYKAKSLGERDVVGYWRVCVKCLNSRLYCPTYRLVRNQGPPDTSGIINIFPFLQIMSCSIAVAELHLRCHHDQLGYKRGA